MLTVELVYIGFPPKKLEYRRTLSLPLGCSIQEAIKLSGILIKHPEISLKACVIGVWSQKVLLSDRVKQGDRIEICRPLLIDPKEARQRKLKV